MPITGLGEGVWLVWAVQSAPKLTPASQLVWGLSSGVQVARLSMGAVGAGVLTLPWAVYVSTWPGCSVIEVAPPKQLAGWVAAGVPPASASVQVSLLGPLMPAGQVSASLPDVGWVLLVLLTLTVYWIRPPSYTVLPVPGTADFSSLTSMGGSNLTVAALVQGRAELAVPFQHCALLPAEAMLAVLTTSVGVATAPAMAVTVNSTADCPRRGKPFTPAVVIPKSPVALMVPVAGVGQAPNPPGKGRHSHCPTAPVKPVGKGSLNTMLAISTEPSLVTVSRNLTGSFW